MKKVSAGHLKKVKKCAMLSVTPMNAITPNLSKTCPICNKLFTKDYGRGLESWKKATYCSNACKAKATRPAWKGGTIIHGGRVWIHNPLHPNACMARKTYVQRSRLVLSEELGRTLSKGEIVHHIDGNPLNDDITNLLLVSRKEHGRIHAKESKGHIGKNRHLACTVAG